MTAIDEKTLAYLLSPSRSGLDPSLFVPLLRLLAEGEPVTIAELATASGRSENTVRRGLSSVPDAEYDDDGRILGLALTLRPTPHRFTVAGRQLYTWCALDTLFFPALIGKAATIESTSTDSGISVRVTTGTDGTITSVQPDTAVLSLLIPDHDGPVRSSFCNQVHYFASREEAQPWLDAHPDGEVLDIEAAHRVGAAVASSMLAQADTADPDSVTQDAYSAP
ncbi:MULTISPECIES: organomercurial lyase MerB [Rhodococcus]|jgi:alkylmercury lyase|uniref:organomercurial lyase MerB n=1 Tax=Rhodococcus TaxID=1827 RepID=UPI00071E4529|nr:MULTISPECIES: organomercurial lyase MerB [Rhodococcus]KSU68309.1 alkylmercury lyase [Rhodococcus qingshengii]MDV8128532.1 organomercurial lyase MerB [Rhodococcus sp. IEGM 1304]SCC69293.1 alkylmercury lyase [Rhodococcus qingshengii]